jgi:hypothetical protein
MLIDEFDNSFECLNTNARRAARKARGEDDHHRPRGFDREILADTCCVRSNDVCLKFAGTRVLDADAREAAETRVQSVDRITSRERALDDCARGGDARARTWREFNPDRRSKRRASDASDIVD